MSCTRSKLVAQAQKWAGLREDNGTFKVIIDTYNSHKPLARGYKLKYTDEWCSGFASACAIACGATDIIPTEVGCGKHIDLFKKNGIWVEDDSYVPKPGDYIFYDWQDSGIGDNKGGADHVGIVEKTENGRITVIEGNYAGGVNRRVLSVNGKYIRGYGVPKYDREVDVTYRVYVDGRWLPSITGYNNVNGNGYAGIYGKSISGIQAKMTNGKSVTICSHLNGNASTNWLPPVTKWDNTDNGYSGVKGKPIDCVAMKADEYKLRYRVHVKGGKWLPWVPNYDITDYDNGLAGIYGKTIDAIQITVVD